MNPTEQEVFEIIGRLYVANTQLNRDNAELIAENEGLKSSVTMSDDDVGDGAGVTG